MINQPPKTGDLALDQFLNEIYEFGAYIEDRTMPENGWSLSDFTAEVSEIIGDKRDLIDIVDQFNDIGKYRQVIQEQKEYLDGLAAELRRIAEHSEHFTRVMEWWDQNYKIVEDAQESLNYMQRAEESALIASEHEAKSKINAQASAESAIESAQSATDANTYRQGALTYREGSKAARDEANEFKDESLAARDAARAYRDGAKDHREAAKLSEDNAASSAQAANTSANAAAESATEVRGKLQQALSAIESAEGIESDLRALMDDTESWNNVVTALEQVDADIAAATDALKEDILGGVGPAFDTLKELADAFGENADAISTLTAELAKKADKGHTHTSADITDAYHYMGEEACADRVVKTHSNGHIYMRTDPPAADALARRAYVDRRADEKSDKGHNHTISEVNGLQTALDGKSPVKHIHSISEIDGLEADLSSRSPEGHKHTSGDITDAVDHIHSGRVGQVVKVGDHGHIRDGNPPANQYDLANKLYVDTEVGKKADTGHKHSWSEIEGKPSTYKPSSHKHTSAEITDSVSYVNGAQPGRVVATHTSGSLRVTNLPTDPDDVAQKKYVDQEVGKKADEGHTHPPSDITGSKTWIGRAGDSNGIVKTTSLGWIHIGSDPTVSTHPARKGYVDRRPALFSGNGAPGTVPYSVPGDMYLDLDTMEIYRLD